MLQSRRHVAVYDEDSGLWQTHHPKADGYRWWVAYVYTAIVFGAPLVFVLHR
ncbi:hypothetical protein [Streptomyces sp. NPDC087300]|uniref:hypothetical protein n=1 Tax=Streptomyces sp. NPDC087300 TaxID=3365780 RepID=UPI0038084FFA